ncbi:MAG: hypothetical protein M0R77_12795 [Gammaproteobacteria bacterium]|nr:hypothetical protein [Gammaproteobacteria bacterium]
MELMDYQWERILPALKAAGFTGAEKRLNRRTRNDILVPFVREIALNEHDNITTMSKVTLYATDAYPVTGKEEAVLTAWDLTGRDNKALADRIVQQLNKLGIAARRTTYKKYNVVAFDPGDWLNVACGQ